jgi:hypothetical protein
VERQELVEFVAEILADTNNETEPKMVNFFDHEVDWKLIASVTLAVLTARFKEVPWGQQ